MWLHVAAAMSLLAAAAGADARPPNVVVILADDLGWADLGCYGSRYHETPHLDRLAASGMRFTDAYAAGSNCQPTRAALLSGQYAPRTGVYTVGSTRRWDTSRRPLVPVENRERIPAGTATVADVLRSAGYATGMFGKWHLDEGGDRPAGRGFDEAIVAGGIVRQGHFRFRTAPPVDVPEGTYLADFLTDRAVDFIARHRDRPFFLYLPHFAVHSPFEAKPEVVARFAGKPPVGDQKSPVYAAMIASLDESVGRIVAALAEAGVADDTLVIFTSDNGGVGGYARAGLPSQEITDNRPLRGGKGTFSEGGIRVPFIATWPGKIRPGTTCGEPVISVDLLPTLAAAAGAALPDQPVDGVDIGPLFVGGCGRPLGREAIYWHFPGYLGAGADHAARDTWRTTPVGAIRAGRHKLVEHFEDGRFELYDLAADPGEARDLAAAEPDLTKKLAAQLATWRKRVRAPMPARRQPAPSESAGPPAEARRPNVLFIAVDDLRPELGCYGRPAIRSPHIDRLAARGTLFERAYCMVPVCGASRASLMTGVRPTPTRFLAYDTAVDRDAPGITPLHAHFRAHGYRTATLGKILHVEGDAAAGWSEPEWRPDVSWYATPANLETHLARGRSNPKLRGPATEAADRPDDRYGDAVLATRAIADLERLAAGEDPFFLGVGFLKPHLPFVAPQRYWDLYDPAEIVLPDHRHPPTDVPKAALTAWGELRCYVDMPAAGPLTDEQARRLIHGYRACVSFVDAQIGRLVDAVDRLGLADDTIVVLWGDHGWNLGEHGLWCKHVCYETAMRVPLIVVAPGKPGGRARGLVELIDIYPSLCELAGLPPPPHLEGASFVPLLSDPTLPGRPAAVGRFGSGDTIRTDRHRFAEYTGPRGVAAGRMLFDHEADPAEHANIADHPEARDLSERLSAELRGHRSRVPGPTD